MSTRLAHHQQLLADLLAHCRQQLQDDPQHADAAKSELFEELETLLQSANSGSLDHDRGQALIGRIVSHFPVLTPYVHRDLFWFFGGDCLHFMTDEEIENYQRLEEACYELEQAGETVDYSSLRAKLFGLH